MHVMSRVYSFPAEYLVFTLELIQAHKTSDISTQQMYLSDSMLKGDSLHNENPPIAWRLKQVAFLCHEILGWGRSRASVGELSKEHISCLDQPCIEHSLAPQSGPVRIKVENES